MPSDDFATTGSSGANQIYVAGGPNWRNHHGGNSTGEISELTGNSTGGNSTSESAISFQKLKRSGEISIGRFSA